MIETEAGDSRYDDHGAWVPGPRCERAPLAYGLLAGLQVAVKDLIDVAGAVTGCGNPDWAASHALARRDAAVVTALRKAGAAVAGKSVTDEFAFSLEGENAHHGTPRNPRAPDRLPGGSSSGSAVAVAAGLVDVALGTDTGGSVRVPGSFCGLYAIRPTHGAVSLDGVLAFAPSYDTVGWFARDAALLRRVGDVLLPAEQRAAASPCGELRLVRDAFALADDAVARWLADRAAEWCLGPSMDVYDGEPGMWLTAYATLQGDEIRRHLVPEMQALRPRLGATIATRFAGLDAIGEFDVQAARAWRRRQADRLDDLLGGGVVLVVPTTPGPALARSAGDTERSAFYAAALTLNAIAGHVGLPQVTLPFVPTDDGVCSQPEAGLPIGLSLIGARGSDASLLELAETLTTPGPNSGRRLQRAPA